MDNLALIDAMRSQLGALDTAPIVKGTTTWWRLMLINERTGEITRLVEQQNIIPYQGADVFARLLAGDVTYAPGAMFFEFENTVGDPVAPTPARDEDINYYLSTLLLNPNRDYMRIPLVVSPSLTASGDDYDGNQVTFFAITAGLTGVHGLTFDQSVDSKVYGVALAATPTPAQYTSDLLFSRSYAGFTAVPKQDGFAIGAQYMIRFL